MLLDAAPSLRGTTNFIPTGRAPNLLIPYGYFDETCGTPFAYAGTWKFTPRTTRYHAKGLGLVSSLSAHKIKSEYPKDCTDSIWYVSAIANFRDVARRILVAISVEILPPERVEWEYVDK